VGEGPRALLQSIREGGETALERVGDARAAEGGEHQLTALYLKFCKHIQRIYSKNKVCRIVKHHARC